MPRPSFINPRTRGGSNASNVMSSRLGFASSVRSTSGDQFQTGALASYEALLAGGDKRKETLVRRKDANLDKLLAMILQEHLKQKLAATYYQAINTYILFTPTMIITLLSAIISIFSTSELVQGDVMKVKLGIAVSFFQILLSVFQSLSKQLNFGAKAGYHKAAAVTLKKILDRTMFSRNEDKYQSLYTALKNNSDLKLGNNIAAGRISEMPNKFNSIAQSKLSVIPDEGEKHDDATLRSGTEHDLQEDMEDPFAEGEMHEGEFDVQHEGYEQKPISDAENANSITKQYLQAIEQVDSFVPAKIISAFNVLHHRIQVINQSVMTNKTQSLVAWEQVYPPLYFQLSETIIEYWGWPIFIPSASHTVETCLKNFKHSLNVEVDNNADLLMDLLDRSNQIRSVQERLTERQTHRKRRQKLSDQDIHQSNDMRLDAIHSAAELASSLQSDGEISFFRSYGSVDDTS